MTVVVKATLDLVPDGVCRLASEQRLLTGDEHHDGDPELSVRYPSDMAVLKPRGECLFVGACHAPGGRPVRTTKVGFRVGPIRKELAVIGDRVYTGRVTTGISRPEPFVRMPLTWERAFGGPGVADNPVGKGLEAVDGPGGRTYPLANVEDPQRLIVARSDRPAPAGLGPIPRSWPRRMALTGTYDARWLQSRWPWLPDDFRYDYHLESPADQRMDGYFRGDEQIALVHLHPKHPELRTRLPGLRARAFVDRAGRRGLEELRMELDTLVVEGDESRVTCLWRGVTEVADEALGDVVHLFVGHETSAAREPDPAAWLARCLARQDAVEADDEPGEAPAGADDDGDRATLHHDPGRSTFLRSDDEDEGRSTVMLDAIPAVAPPAALAPPSDRPDAPGDDPARQPLLPAPAPDVEPAPSRPPDDDPDDLDDLDDAGRATRMHVLGGPPPVADAGDAPDEHEDRATTFLPQSAPVALAAAGRVEVQRRLAGGLGCAGAVLAGADLSKLDLTGVDFTGAILAGVDLTGARLDEATLDGATLVGARLTGASLRSTSLVEADLSGAIGERLELDRTKLDDAELAEATLTGAVFTSVSARGASFARASMAGMRAQDSDFDGADLSGAMLEDAKLLRCTLVDAWLESGTRARGLAALECDLDKLRASEGCDLRLADLRAANLDGARFGTSDLSGANLSLAKLSRADFSDAVLVGTQLFGCVLVQARFDRARLRSAVLDAADLREAQLSDADLTDAHLRGANLYGAELWNAKLTRTSLELANLEGTKLA